MWATFVDATFVEATFVEATIVEAISVDPTFVDAVLEERVLKAESAGAEVELAFDALPDLVVSETVLLGAFGGVVEVTVLDGD